MAPLFEYLEIPGLRFYHGAEQFIEQVEAALRNDTPALAAERQAAIKDGTWDARAAQLARLIHGLLRPAERREASCELYSRT
jgi:hypothetical protein